MENPWPKFIPQIPTRLGASEYFTGVVQISELLTSPEPMSLQVYRVVFAPGARTAWHTHPKGQVLHLEAGIGWFQRWGGEILEIKAGDTLYIPPGEKHWHGASPGHTMIHLAMQGVVDGVGTEWLEHVTDEQYKL